MRIKITFLIIPLVLVSVFLNIPQVEARINPELETVRQFFLKGEYERVVDQLPNLNIDEGGIDALEALYYIGTSLIKVGRFSEARDVLSRIIQRKVNVGFRDHVELRIADAFQAEGVLEIALNRFQNVMAVYPESSGLAHAYKQSALICQKLGKFDQAESYLKLLQMNYPLSFEAAEFRRGMAEQIAHFGVQIGSFADSQNAEQLKTELETKGFHPYIKTVREDKVPLYRVLIGEFSSRQEAEKTAEHIESLGYPAQIYP